MAETAFGNAEETMLRWRKTLVPGPSGLDDAVQMVLDIGDQPGNPFSNSKRTYTPLRDELSTVIGIIAEDEGGDPKNPSVPVRYAYTPFGEGHAESGPKRHRALFDADTSETDVHGTVKEQTVADPATAAAGALVLDWSAALDLASLAPGLVVEKLTSGSGWVALTPAEVAVGVEPDDGTVSNSSGAKTARLIVLALAGWQRDASYRVRLTPQLRDTLGRSFGRSETLEWRVPATGAVLFDNKAVRRFESWEAASDTVGGRFPGGQTLGFQGLWTDPVTGFLYARNRWYDPRNGAWLSEDAAGTVDSPNLYAFVGHQPNVASDPLGLQTGLSEEEISKRARGIPTAAEQAYWADMAEYESCQSIVADTTIGIYDSTASEDNIALPGMGLIVGGLWQAFGSATCVAAHWPSVQQTDPAAIVSAGMTFGGVLQGGVRVGGVPKPVVEPAPGPELPVVPAPEIAPGLPQPPPAVPDVPWVRPAGWKLPASGTWEGTPGNSRFVPNNPAQYGLKPGEGVVFKEGYPVFSPYAREVFEVPEMTGLHDADMPAIHREIARRHGWMKPDGTPNAARARAWLSAEGLTPHHAGGKSVEVIPTKVNKIQHVGGAFDLRNQ
ncbi:MAG TPA: RHS repeat-associated core domain-containing protein [Thermoanaerobaculia bacterium]|nr:RHS repeat-associated core domain-containing protein [Thermoanaerobaculia bacterium]